jgi:hypothetical protein
MLGDKTDIYKEPAMSIVTLSLPDVKPKTEIRPKVCPYCSGETFQRWGRVRKPVKDNHFLTVLVYRYCVAIVDALSDTILLGLIVPIKRSGCGNYQLSYGYLE